MFFFKYDFISDIFITLNMVLKLPILFLFLRRETGTVRAINAVRFYNLILMMRKERPELNIRDIYTSMSREHT